MKKHQKKHHRHNKVQRQAPPKEGAEPEEEPEKNATVVETMIRQKGSFIIAYVDVKQNLNDVYNNTMAALKEEKKKEDEEAQKAMKEKIDKVKAASAAPAAAAKPKKLHKKHLKARQEEEEEKPAFGGLKSSDMITDDTSENNLFDNISVEFPSYCRPLWSKAVEINVAKKAAEMLPCWKKAAKAENATFLELPFLNATQFSEFYECVASGDEKLITLEKQNIQVEDSLKRPEGLLRIACFNDPYRIDIGWLEFWVYVCSDGKRPKEESYMSSKQVPLEEQILNKMKKDAEKRAQRQKLMDQDQMKDLQAKANKSGENITVESKVPAKRMRKSSSSSKGTNFIENALFRLMKQGQHFTKNK